MVGEYPGDVHQSVAEGPAGMDTPPGLAISCRRDELQRAGLLGSIVERASEALVALHGCPGTCCHGANTLE
jgi:hypothetical protein